jgi:hypothetical protein
MNIGVIYSTLQGQKVDSLTADQRTYTKAFLDLAVLKIEAIKIEKKIIAK